MQIQQLWQQLPCRGLLCRSEPALRLITTHNHARGGRMSHLVFGREGKYCASSAESPGSSEVAPETKTTRYGFMPNKAFMSKHVSCDVAESDYRLKQTARLQIQLATNNETISREMRSLLINSCFALGNVTCLLRSKSWQRHLRNHESKCSRWHACDGLSLHQHGFETQICLLCRSVCSGTWATVSVSCPSAIKC
jgi:hypothetical protein